MLTPSLTLQAFPHAQGWNPVAIRAPMHANNYKAWQSTKRVRRQEQSELRGEDGHCVPGRGRRWLGEAEEGSGVSVGPPKMAHGLLKTYKVLSLKSPHDSLDFSFTTCYMLVFVELFDKFRSPQGQEPDLACSLLHAGTWPRAWRLVSPQQALLKERMLHENLMVFIQADGI